MSQVEEVQLGQHLFPILLLSSCARLGMPSATGPVQNVLRLGGTWSPGFKPSWGKGLLQGFILHQFFACIFCCPVTGAYVCVNMRSIALQHNGGVGKGIT